jgi:hypothetical protein
VGDYSKAIDGLTDNEQYYVLVVDSNHIKLIGKKPIDLDNTYVNTGAQHTLTPMEVKQFTAGSDVNADTDTFTITGHGFTNGETVIYSSLDNDLIGGLEDMTQYTVVFIDANSFKLNDSTGALVNITSTSSGVQAFIYPDSTHAMTFTASGTTVVNSNSDTIAVNATNLKTGDVVFYTVDPLKTTTITMDYKYGFQAGGSGSW